MLTPGRLGALRRHGQEISKEAATVSLCEFETYESDIKRDGFEENVSHIDGKER